MKNGMLGLFGVVIQLVAQTLGQSSSLPSCAVSCANQYASGSTFAGCQGTDVACICSNTTFITSISCCVFTNCNATDQASTVSYAQSLCSANGVSNLPSAASCASSSSSGTTDVVGGTVTNSGSSSSTSSFSTTSQASSSSSSATDESASSSKTRSITTSSTGTSSTGPSSTTSTSQTPSQSPPGTPPAPAVKSKSGLSAGAKAGIAIAAIVAFLVALLAIFFLRRHQKSKNSGQLEGTLPHGSELPTKSNTHEIEGRKTGHELSNKPAEDHEIFPVGEVSPSYPAMSELAAEKSISRIQRKELPTQANNRELDPNLPAAEFQGRAWDQSQIPQQTFSQPFQPSAESFEPHVGSDNSAIDAAAIHHKPDSSRASSQTLADVGTGSSRMDELRAKRDRIRAEKERLLKLQELDEMEAAVHREMQEEQDKESRSGQ